MYLTQRAVLTAQHTTRVHSQLQTTTTKHSLFAILRDVYKRQPYVYAWTGASNALRGAWPGTQLTSKDDNGDYYVDINTTEADNGVLNNGGKVQSADITGITGDAIITVKNLSLIHI